MTRRSGGQSALAVLLALLGFGSVFLTWHHATLLGLSDADDGWERWQGVATAALFGGSVVCIALSRRERASAWWQTFGYFLLPLATVAVLGCYAWDFIPAGLKARVGVGTRLGAAFREFGGTFKWNSIGPGAYAALGLAVGILIVGFGSRTRRTG